MALLGMLILGPGAFANAIVFIFYFISLMINTLVIYPIAKDICTIVFLIPHIKYDEISQSLKTIIQNIQVLAGIVMLFVVAFSLLKIMVNPDSKTAVGSGLAKSIVIAIVLLVASPFVFNLLGDLQEAIIKDELIEKLILYDTDSDLYNTVTIPGTTDTHTDTDTHILFDKAQMKAKKVTYDIFRQFYKNEGYHVISDLVDKGDKEIADIILEFTESTIGVEGYASQIKSGSLYIWGYVKYVPVVTGIAGIFLIIMFAYFVVDLAVRSFTLILMQLIFPIIAIAYIIPEKGKRIFNGYLSHYLMTYVSYFLKIASIYLTLFIISFIMNALRSDSSNLFGTLGISSNHPIIKALITIFLIVALFAFYKKGIPTLAKQVFGIDVSSNRSYLSKAVGFASGALALAAGAATGGIAAGAAGLGKAAVAKAAVTTGFKAAGVGSALGKNLAEGKVVAGVKGAVTGGMGVYSQAKSSVDKNKKYLTGQADEAQAKYNNLNDEYKKENEILNTMADSDPAKAEQQEKVNNLSKQVAIAKQEAIGKVNEAKKIDSNYKPKAVERAEQAEKDYRSKKIAAEQAKHKTDTIVASAQSDYDTKSAAADAAWKRAESLKDSNPSEYQKASQEATELSKEAATAHDALENIKSSSTYRMAEAEAKILEESAVQSYNNAKAAAKEAKNWDNSYTSVLLVDGSESNSNPAVQQQSRQQQSQTQTVTQQQATQQQPKSTSQQGAEQSRPVQQVKEQQSNSVDQQQGTQQPKPVEQVRPTEQAKGQSEEPVIVIGNPEAEEKAFENTAAGRPIFEGINKDGSVEKPVNNNANNSTDEPLKSSEGNTNSGYVGREDADKNATDGLNENIKDNNVSKIRSYLGSDLETDKTEDDSDKRAHSAGSRTTRRIQELMHSGMSALDATNQAYMEADNIINTEAQRLINNGVNPESAIQQARREYEEGRI